VGLVAVMSCTLMTGSDSALQFVRRYTGLVSVTATVTVSVSVSVAVSVTVTCLCNTYQ
jgi:hypothetical protein